MAERIVYKAQNSPNQHQPDVFILTEPGMAAKYRAQKKNANPQDNSPKINLIDVAQKFEVYQSETGKGFEGKISRPSKAVLDSIFNTEDESAIIEEIILNGEIQGAH
ncbi:hypothetical protein BX616_010932 [Lobosporangium transversale]|uniref:Ribosome maturation protein SDO1/SBDS N-terminal domain-containing protein n=1 Tax=Lobosporangium transversale TaxID=64571 RepID=A0A1Y2H153_9FUNG|nr:hypothetical protein BCR41DRAFT_344968 [Lobosporangium transversale]KAF9910158.1 hypothetical protein BX616_010932 [Lobosporangium transversale]ORZ28280.1 hypothetical protein BCR41DRAFT_344968 [Lobosporangium transversale]|eukprot:XP_021885965.1 hypothetical protein BCR41DRAFT_344968 [Lobosporangium transversale]